MNGKVKRPFSAVNTSSTATSLCLKYRSTRYLSKCAEMAQRTGPENAKKSQAMNQFCQCRTTTANAGRARQPTETRQRRPLREQLPGGGGNETFSQGGR